MGFIGANRNLFTEVVFVVLSIFLLLMMSNNVQQIEGMRPLQEDEWLNNNIVLIHHQSLQKRPVTPPHTPSPCHTLPGKPGGGHCPINNGMMNFAGRDIDVHHHHDHASSLSTPAIPSVLVDSVVNETDDQTRQQDRSA
ncbi:hypothetical protein BVC80_441g28 [Macleaya cordata]|uniref:Uncharacterized protein n=1 Tax=Macleaya cordata TaxID=56857 RepID=A0A200Q4H0_MACCD|nr:hypothetical protein BVC80_441g28 [Macleaya cordata]